MKKMTLLAIGLMILACGEKKPETKTIEGKPSPAAKETYSSAEGKATFKDSTIALVYDKYNRLKTALVNTDSEQAMEAGEALQDEVKTLEGSEGLKNAISQLVSAEDIEEQRNHFQAVTAGIKALVENNIVEGTLYYQYCPMAFEGKGAYWLSNEERIMNPYFGDKMLHCGAVEEEIN